MTRTIAALVLALPALLATPSLSRAGDLTLRDVIELHRTGLGEDLLIAVIDADGGPFALTFADIQDLKSDGLSERVITALVRTGARQAALDGEGVAPVVQVQQDVITYVVPAIVVVDSTGVGRSPRRSEGQHDDARGTQRDGASHPRSPAPPPPATWVTRREDGRNVAGSGDVRTTVPAATWVTPRAGKQK